MPERMRRRYIMDSALRAPTPTTDSVYVSADECSEGGVVPRGGLTGDGQRPWWLGGVRRMVVARQRDLGYHLATEKGR